MRAATISKIRDITSSAESDAIVFSERSTFLYWLPWLFWVGTAIAAVAVALIGPLSQVAPVAWDAAGYYQFFLNRAAYFQADPGAAFPYPPLVAIPALRVMSFLPIWLMIA